MGCDNIDNSGYAYPEPDYRDPDYPGPRDDEFPTPAQENARLRAGTGPGGGRRRGLGR